MKTPVLEALFNKAQTKGLLLYQKQLQHWCFPVKFTNLLETPILKNICEQLLLWKLLCWRWLKFGIGLLSGVAFKTTILKKIKLTNLDKICLVAFSQTFAEGGIFRSLSKDTWLFSKAVNFFRQSSILEVWLGFKYTFGAFCTEYSTKGTNHCFR